MNKRTGLVLCLAVLLSSIVPVSAAAKQNSQVYEAENGILTGTKASADTPDYSGTGYVTGFEDEGDAVTVNVQASQAGLYQINIRYNAPQGQKQANLSVNGISAGTVDFAPTASFTEIAVTKALLNQGSNTIRLDKGWGWYDIDYFSIKRVTEIPQHKISKSLSNPHASSEAKSLMSYLVDSYGHQILSGQQDYSNVEWLEQNLGKRPAVVGFDLMDYSPSRTAFGASTDEIENAIKWDRQGGITAFVWHWNAPAGLINQPEKEWWRGFYTDSTTFDIQYAISHPDSEEYALLLRDIDAIAAQLQRLQDARIPVLFRPLHEAEGGWFWWGAKGAEPAKALYRLLYDRLTNEHRLNNLIWVWNSVSPDWYPGDDVVDIVSYDSYPQAGDYHTQIGKYDQLLELADDRKLVAMTENGAIPDPDLLQAYHADWSWFSTWGSYDGNTNSLEHLKKVYNHEYVVTLDELPNLKNYPVEANSLQPPDGLQAKWNNGKVHLKWNKVNGAKSYSVLRSTAIGGPYAIVASGLKAANYVNAGLKKDVNYYYIVRSVDKSGSTSDSAPLQVSLSSKQDK